MTSTLSAGQEEAIARVAEWLQNAPQVQYCSQDSCVGRSDGEEHPHTHGSAQDYPVMSIGGLAGSGKTHVTGQLSDALGIRASFGTPTNKAAAVLRGKLPEQLRGRCSTYHSLLYTPNCWYSCLTSGNPADELSCHCGHGFEHDDCTCAKFACSSCPDGAEKGCPVEEHLSFEPRAFAGGYRDLIIIDEASMVTEEQVNSIRAFGLPVLLVGDHGQLPPVKGVLSPWMLSPDVILSENFRQQEESGIVRAALSARAHGSILPGKYGTTTLVARGSDRPELYDALLPHRLVPGPDSAIITWTNKGRADANRRIHAAVAMAAGLDPQTPLVPNDRVISLGRFQCLVAKPAEGGGWKATGAPYHTFNGQCGTVLEVIREGKKWLDAVIAMESPEKPDAKPEEMQKVIRRIDIAQLGADRTLRPDERANGAAAMDYSYCVTAHKAQGSEFASVAVLSAGPTNGDRGRWQYTAITRAKERCLVIL